jgi:hypothetical protein
VDHGSGMVRRDSTPFLAPEHSVDHNSSELHVQRRDNTFFHQSIL